MEQILTDTRPTLPKPIVKQEMDESLKKGAHDESGIFSNHSANVSDNSADGNWDCHEGEVSDPKFDPPIQSTNLRKIPPCNISAIDGQVGMKDISAKGSFI